MHCEYHSVIQCIIDNVSSGISPDAQIKISKAIVGNNLTLCTKVPNSCLTFLSF